jgi:hypothetical protein
MLEHERCHYVILKEAVSMTRGGEETLGWQTNRATLGILLTNAGMDGNGRAWEDALLLMRKQNKVMLHKILFAPPHRTYALADFCEYRNASEFFSAPFNIRVLPEGTAYLSELDGKMRAELESAQMAKRTQQKKRFAVGTHVLIGMGQLPGVVKQLDDRPSTLGEYAHTVETEHGQRRVLGCEMEVVPEPITNADRRPVAGFRDVHMYGHNSRLNLNSTDNSTNTVLERNKNFFADMRQSAQQIENESTRNEVVKSIDELEKNQGQGGWTHAYEKFIGLVADHMTIFLPFLPKLMHIATGLL